MADRNNHRGGGSNGEGSSGTNNSGYTPQQQQMRNVNWNDPNFDYSAALTQRQDELSHDYHTRAYKAEFRERHGRDPEGPELTNGVQASKGIAAAEVGRNRPGLTPAQRAQHDSDHRL